MALSAQSGFLLWQVQSDAQNRLLAIQNGLDAEKAKTLHRVQPLQLELAEAELRQAKLKRNIEFWKTHEEMQV